MPAERNHSTACHLFFSALTRFIPLLVACTASAASSVAERRPLDPLTREEIMSAANIIAASGRIDAATRASIITLEEPDKTTVLRWKPGDPVARKAFAVLRVNAETVEVVVDLDSNAIVSWTPIPGAQPAIHSAEWAEAERLVKADRRWRDAMRARGYRSVENIFCDSLSAGYFEKPEEAGRRLIKMPCYDVSSARSNVYARPIEGVIATVDLDAKRVVSVLDEGVVAVSPLSHELDEGASAELRPPMRPVRSTAPAGWNFRLDGRVVSWQGWSFHLGFEQRFGPVLSLVAIEDGGRMRSVLYQAHLSEAFVPYMEPSPSWSFRTYMDAGEYGLGALSSSLMPGVDCPPGAVFLDAALSTPTGGAYERQRVMCVFERDAAAPLWRHSEGLTGVYEGRPDVELVVRSIPSIAHYDYVIDWVFSQSGAIDVKIGATGIDAVKAVAFETMADPQARQATEHGTLVAPWLVAVHHDHYFSLRLDFDIDGPVNKFVRERLEPVALQNNPRRSIWRLGEDPMLEEGSLAARDGPQVWRVENPMVTTNLGHHPGYQIQGQGPTSLLARDDWPQRRAAFSEHTLWITRRHQRERFAAGAYPNQSRGGDGLPSYVDGEAIDGHDLVAWYTIGFQHVTRPEDWPVLSTVWKSVKLRPFGFFTHNPGIRVRRRFADDQG